jgi:hypothetical protein
MISVTQPISLLLLAHSYVPAAVYQDGGQCVRSAASSASGQLADVLMAQVSGTGDTKHVELSFVPAANPAIISLLRAWNDEDSLSDAASLENEINDFTASRLRLKWP